MRNHLWKVLTILGATLLVYLRVLGGDFVWEDITFIVNNSYIHHLANIPTFFTSGDCVGLNIANFYYRPVTTLTFALDYHFWGLNPSGYHATSLLLHLGASLLLYSLFARFFDSRLALLGALLFACYPVNVEPVAYICSRADLTCGIFLLASVLAFVLYQERGGKHLLALSVIFCALSLFSKIVGHLAPLVIAGLVYIRGNPRREWKVLLPFLAVTALYWVMRLNAAGMTPIDGDPLGERIATSGMLFFHYFAISLFPINLKYFYFLDRWTDPAAPTVLAAWCTLLALFGFTAWKVWKKSLPALGFSWYLIGILPVSGLIAILSPTIIAHRYFYIPLMGGLFGVIALFDRATRTRWLKGRETLCLGAGLLVVALFAAQSFARVGVWKTNLTLWGEAYKTSPKVAGVVNGYSSALLDAERFDEAERILRELRASGGGDTGTEILHAITLMERGGYVEAGKALLSVLRKEPENTWALSIYAEDLYYLGAPCEGEKAASRALSLDPNNRRLIELRESLGEECGGQGK